MISVCFITKNEEKWIGECIEHLRDLVTEFIVLDTGSTDRTVEIAKSKGAVVKQTEWPGDFATARNESLKLATQPWILKIDPDERVHSSEFQKIRDLTQSEGVAYQFWTRAYTNDAEKVSLQSYETCRGEYPELERNYRGYLTYPSIRLFRRLPGIHYSGRIHESIERSLPGWTPARSPVLPPVNVTFHHYGHNDAAVKEKNKAPLYEKLLKEEAEENPNNWYVNFELGFAYFQQNKLSEAIHYFEQAHRALPNKPQVMCNLGYALILNGKRDAGEKFLRECLAVDPHYHDAYLNLGASALGANDPAKALTFLDECLKLYPNSFTALRARAQCLAQLNRVEKAEEDFLRAIQIVPHFLDAKIDLAMLYAQTSRREKAAEILRSVIAENPTNERALAVQKWVEDG